MSIRLLHRKERVILTAIEIIGELGMQGLSTKEIAKRQQISEGTLFRHFKSKNEIIIAVLDYFSQYDTDVFATVELKKMTAKEGILFIADSLATYYENYPAMTAVSQLFGILSFDPELGEKSKSIQMGRHQFFIDIVTAGQARGEFVGINAKSVADVLYGTFIAVCTRWRLAGQNFSLREEVLLALNLVLDAFTLQAGRGKNATSINY